MDGVVGEASVEPASAAEETDDQHVVEQPRLSVAHALFVVVQQAGRPCIVASPLLLEQQQPQRPDAGVERAVAFRVAEDARPVRVGHARDGGAEEWRTLRRRATRRRRPGDTFRTAAACSCRTLVPPPRWRGSRGRRAGSCRRCWARPGRGASLGEHHFPGLHVARGDHVAAARGALAHDEGVAVAAVDVYG